MRKLRLVILLVVAGGAADVSAASPERLRGTVTAASPTKAVTELARRVVGVEEPLELSPRAFEGLPEPGRGIVFAARALQVDEVGFRLSVSVEARRGGSALARRTYVFPWQLRQEVVVPKRVIRAGKTIRSSDLEVRSVALDESYERYVLDAEALVGRVARRTLPPGLPVSERLVELPAVVERGAAVKVRMHVGAMLVTMSGEALEDGAVGKTVKVLNPSSKRILSGRVVDHGLIEVMQ
jgi:flagella basal body P-ring formation protein FlgA